MPLLNAKADLFLKLHCHIVHGKDGIVQFSSMPNYRCILNASVPYKAQRTERESVCVHVCVYGWGVYDLYDPDVTDVALNSYFTFFISCKSQYVILYCGFLESIICCISFLFLHFLTRSALYLLMKILFFFFYLQVMLRDDQSVEDGQKIAEDIMTKLSISKNDLLDCAYMDIILKNK